MTHEIADEDRAIEDVIGRLKERYPATAPMDIVSAVMAARDRFTDARVRDFVPVLIEREARAQLLAGGAL